MRFRFLPLTSLRTSRRVSRPKKGKKALEAPSWTLIELLVVLAIISIIVALLLPAVFRAQHRAKEAVCESMRHRIMRYDEQTDKLQLSLPVPVLTRCYECHIPNRYRQP